MSEQLSKLAATLAAERAAQRPQAGDTYYVEHNGKQRHLRVLSVTLTHVYVRYLDTGYQINVPAGLLARWTKLEPKEGSDDGSERQSLSNEVGSSD